jgi:anti-anti-sigma factor
MPTTSVMSPPAVPSASNLAFSRHLDVQERGDVAVIRFREPRVTDPVEIEELGRQLYQVLEYKNAAKLVLDFSPVEFLSSATIGKLISLGRKAKACNAVVRLCGMQPAVRDIFHFCNLERVFDIYDDEAEAIASF